MKKTTVGMSVLALVLSLGMGLMAHAAGKAKKYEVVDVACYVAKGAHGDAHKECAVKCISGGGELALLSKGKLYIPVDKDFKSAREQFVSKAGETVEVEGKVISKGGVNYLQISGGDSK